MKKTLLSLLILFSLQALAQSDYPERLLNLKQMAARVSGINSTNPDNLGFIGGLYVQTEWQMNSGRDLLTPWSIVNSYLTIEPFRIFKMYESNEACTEDLCDIWTKYFISADLRTGPWKRRVVGRRIWNAHMASIFKAIEHHPDLFEDESIPADEINFVKGWIRFVGIMARINFPTYERLVRVLQNKALPNCSPLGHENCNVQKLPILKRTFVCKIIKLGKLSGLKAQKMAISIARDFLIQ